MGDQARTLCCRRLIFLRAASTMAVAKSDASRTRSLFAPSPLPLPLASPQVFMLCTLYPSLGLARAPVRASKALMGALAMVSRRRRTGRRCDKGKEGWELAPLDVGRCSACSGSSRALSCTPCARTEREKAPILNETDDEAAKTAKSPSLDLVDSGSFCSHGA